MELRDIIIKKIKSPWALLFLAIVIAIGVSWLAFKYLEQREERIKEEVTARSAGRRVPEISVVVPRQDSPIGTTVSSKTFAARSIPEDLVYSDTIKANDFDAFVGQKLAAPLLHGRPLRVSDLMAPEIRDVAAILPSGKRAVTIDIDNLNSISQTVRPGNRLDIFLINRAPKLDPAVPDESLDQAFLFMQDMEVLAVGREFNNPQLHADLRKDMVRPGDVQGAEHGYDTLTLLVTPAEAAKLMVGQKMGSYRVALRGNEDKGEIEMATLTAGDLSPSLPRQRDRGIEFIVGGGGTANDIVSMQSVGSFGNVVKPAPINPQSAGALEKALMQMATPGLIKPRSLSHSKLD